MGPGMNMDFNKNLPYYLLLAFLLSFVILVFQSEGTAGGADDINHYRYARYAFANPGFFFDAKAKTVFTLLCAPVAQLGYDALRVFNVLMGLAAALLTYLTARKLNYNHPLLALFLLVFAPMYTLMMLSGMNEIMFSFFLILGIYLYFSNKSIWSAVVISLLPFIRTEGFIIFPLFMLAFLLNRQWKALPFLFAGFMVISFAGSFYHGDFFWIFTKNPYTGNASDIYGSGELLHYVNQFQAIFGLPLFVLMVGGLLCIPVYFLSRGKEKHPGFIREILVGFSPFLVYFCAHSYVWWKGMGNSVGEIRVMAAVFPSAVLLGLFAWDQLISLLRLRKNTGTAAGIMLAAYLIFVPFQVHAIPVPLAPSQKLIKEAASWLEDMDYTDRKIYFWDPFWWFFLDKDPVNNPNIKEGIYDRNDPGKNILPGEIILWDAHYGPNEGRTALEKLLDNPDFCEIKVFRPVFPFKVLGGYDYEIHIFERLKSPDNSEIQAILDEIQKRENALYRIRILDYEDFEATGYGEDTASLSNLQSRSGSHSFLFSENRAFLTGIEMPLEGINPADDAKFNIRVSHYFETLTPGKDPLLLVMSLQDPNRMLFYQTWDIQPQNLRSWEETVTEHEIPQKGSNPDIVKVYLWNKGGHRVYIDDFIISVKEPRSITK
jgi:hypothetical protein